MTRGSIITAARRLYIASGRTVPQPPPPRAERVYVHTDSNGVTVEWKSGDIPHIRP